MTVHFLNNYSMNWAIQLIEAGRYPRQHLYGVDPWATDEPVRVASYRPESLSSRASARARWVLGDLYQESSVLARARHGDVVYAAEPRCVEGLTWLKAMRMLREPLVAVVHHPLRRSRRSARLLAGLDQIICISQQVAAHLVRDHGIAAHRIHSLAWGPDLECPLYVPTGEEAVVSTGKTHRDQSLLLEALKGTSLPGIVYARSAAEITVPIPPMIDLVTPDTHEDRGREVAKFSFEHVVADLASAAVVVIPLSKVDRLAGLSELVDAMALGKPVVMTRNRYIDLDIEGLGFGRWVPPHDVNALRKAVEELMGDPALRKSMGARARVVAERGCNERSFRSEVRLLLQASRR